MTRVPDSLIALLTQIITSHDSTTCTETRPGRAFRDPVQPAGGMDKKTEAHERSLSRLHSWGRAEGSQEPSSLLPQGLPTSLVPLSWGHQFPLYNLDQLSEDAPWDAGLWEPWASLPCKECLCFDLYLYLWEPQLKLCKGAIYYFYKSLEIISLKVSTFDIFGGYTTFSIY